MLDNQSTIDLFFNTNLLNNIRKVKDYVNIHCHAGNIILSMTCELPGYELVWHYPDAITNILSLFLVQHWFHIQYDNQRSDTFVVWNNDDTYRYCRPGGKRLYNLDYKDRDETTLVNEGHQPKTMNIVADRLTRFSQRQINDAKTAQWL